MAAFALLSSLAQAQTTLGPWTPVFKGIDSALGTNTPPAGTMPDLQVVHALRVDLTDPDLRFTTTPRCEGYVPDNGGTCGLETAAYTATNFLLMHGVQIAVNANNFHDQCTADSPSYTIPEGTLVRVTGELICTGQVVSVQEDAIDDSTFRFTANNQVTFIPTNWPPTSTAGVFTSVSGLYAVLVNGVNVGSNYLGNPDFVHQTNPRTAFGLSADRRYLFILTIDGRQPGYSDGALDWETAAWLQLVGAIDGANMDGGGSTCLVMQDSPGFPHELNNDSASAANNRERTVGCHFGIFAQPLRGFINDVRALPDDTAATITWTTTAPATSQVQYGPTSSYGSFSDFSATPVTNHAALLSGLSPSTGYYFQIISTEGPNQYVSSNFYFVTTNYATTNAIFDLTNVWTFMTANLDGINWTATNYDDFGWDGSGPGTLWVDFRGPNPNGTIPVPLNTEMPANPANGYPYITYYLRTHFAFTDSLSGVSLLFHDYLDDGAVFYLNGRELRRLRMAPSPTPIYNSTLAAGFACGGDATCPDDFVVNSVTNLVQGDNVLAAEVHNFSAGSPDITFGLALSYMKSYILPAFLNLSATNGVATLSWSRGGFTLQQADDLTGPWTDVPGPVVSSPYTTPCSGAARYFRLRK